MHGRVPLFLSLGLSLAVTDHCTAARQLYPTQFPGQPGPVEVAQDVEKRVHARAASNEPGRRSRHVLSAFSAAGYDAVIWIVCRCRQSGGHAPGGLSASQRTETSNRNGPVKWINDAKGFGFITPDEGDDLFAHFSDEQAQGVKSLQDGQRAVL